MLCQNLFSGKNKKNILKCQLKFFYPEFKGLKPHLTVFISMKKQVAERFSK